MFVYIWKHNEVPFYVGATKSKRRLNPFNSGGHRNWLCNNKIAEIGIKNVVVEIHTVDTLEEAQILERSLIEKYGRIQLGNGPLTNLTTGGDGVHGMSDENKAKLSLRMKENNPFLKPEIRAKQKARMQDPDVQLKLRGENNPAKHPEARAKIRAKWQEPEFREKQRQRKLGVPIHSDESKELRRQKLLDPTNSMREFHKVLNTDPKIKEKRVATLKTPEVKAKIVAGLKASWARRKGVIM
jgi:hypothetical protein